MGNMSYCRFHNTVGDLDDCYDHLWDNDLSEDEQKARRRLIELCRTIAEECPEGCEPEDDLGGQNRETD